MKVDPRCEKAWKSVNIFLPYGGRSKLVESAYRCLFLITICAGVGTFRPVRSLPDLSFIPNRNQYN